MASITKLNNTITCKICFYLLRLFFRRQLIFRRKGGWFDLFYLERLYFSKNVTIFFGSIEAYILIINDNWRSYYLILSIFILIFFRTLFFDDCMVNNLLLYGTRTHYYYFYIWLFNIHMSYFQCRSPLGIHSCPWISDSQGRSIQHLICLGWRNIGISGLC